MNDAGTAWSVRAWVVLALLNAISVVIAGVFGILALVDPAARPGITGPATADIVLYASLYGIRAVLLTIAVLWLLAVDRRRGGDRLAPVLLLAGAVQVGDILLFIAVGDAVMAIGPAVAAITHLVSVVLLRSHARRPVPTPTPAS